MNGERAIHAVVSGVVQGVTYRQTCRAHAGRLGLVGWVRNRPDGTVEVFAQGSVEEVDSLVDWLWLGPRHARVSGVEVETVPRDPRISRFEVRH